MAVITNPLLVLPAVAGLLALTQTTGDCAFNAENHFGDERGLIQMPQTAEVMQAPDGTPLLLRIGAPHEAESRDAAPLTCAQMQVIDEVELISDLPPGVDCD